MKELEEKLNNILGYLTAMSFDNPELASTLETPLNELSEATEIVNNFVSDPVSGWIPLMENKNLFNREAKHNCKVLFDDGTECDYDDPHPLAMLTHFKISYR